MKSTLRDLGLTPNEISVYEALVRLKGSSSAGGIIKLSDLHRNIVYDCLSHLATKGLVQEVIKNKKKFFTLKQPEALTRTIEKQLKGAEELSSIISKLPLMSAHEVQIYEGSTAWQEAWQSVMSTLKPKTTFYTIGMAGDPWVKLMGETFVGYEQWALKHGITDRIISQKHLQKQIEAHQNRDFRQIRYIDIDLPAHTSIEVFDDRIFFEIYDTPETLIEIKSKSLVITFKAYFDLLWKMGK